MSNSAELNDVDKNMKLIFEKTKQLKNIVKFTNLENNRNSEELHFIRRHLNEISDAMKTSGSNQSSEMQKRTKSSEKKQLELLKSHKNYMPKSHKNYMPNGYTCRKILR